MWDLSDNRGFKNSINGMPVPDARAGSVMSYTQGTT